MAVCLNKNSFYCMHMLPLFASKATFARIDFLRQSERLVDEKGTHSVKFLAEKQTKAMMPHTRTWATARKTRTFTPVRASGCRVCCSRLTETTLWKRRSNLPSTAGFQLVECVLNDFLPDYLLKHIQVLPPTNVAVFWNSSYLSPVLRT